VRAYEGGHPAASPDYLKWSANGSKDGDLVFVSGNPGGTSRELTVSQLAFDRDKVFPRQIPRLAEYRGQLERFVSEGPEQAREADEDLFFIANTFKAFLGEQQALLDPELTPAQKDLIQRMHRTMVLGESGNRPPN
jgi:hypothetical protein